VQTLFGGDRYQQAISDLLSRLNAAGLVAVLDLHRSAPGSGASNRQEQMPDRDHSIEFWRQVAGTFGANSMVVFDLFNEPWPLDNRDSPQAWACWRDGGCILDSQNGAGNYAAAGMNELITAVRSTGATNVVVAGGVFYAEVLDHWLDYRPADPLNNLAASFHAYSFNDCSTLSCYDNAPAQVASSVPLVVGEVGPDLAGGMEPTDASCPASAVANTGFATAFFDWADRHGVSYTAWSWNPWGDCWSLVKSAGGIPTTPWGKQVMARLSKNAQSRE
jgi:endoglucanase